MTVHYTRRAEQALEEIAAYTSETWGGAARAIHGAPGARMRGAGADAVAGRPRGAGRPSLRSLRCERHVIYFRVVEDGFEVVHVLHERQLPKRHL